MITITESSMTFGPFPKENVFLIEKSPCYVRLWNCQGVKTCEFILLRSDKLFFIEAKTSSPRKTLVPRESSGAPSPQELNFRAYITDIVQKMIDSLNIYASILLGKTGKREELQCPDTLKKLSLENVDIVPMLVIKNAEKDWLFPLQDALNRQLKGFFSIWGIRQIVVINEELAVKKYHFSIMSLS